MEIVIICSLVAVCTSFSMHYQVYASLLFASDLYQFNSISNKEIRLIVNLRRLLTTSRLSIPLSPASSQLLRL